MSGRGKTPQFQKQGRYPPCYEKYGSQKPAVQGQIGNRRLRQQEEPRTKCERTNSHPLHYFQEKHFKALREQAAFEAQSKGLDDIIRTLNQIIEAQANPKASEDNLRLPLDYSQDEINGMMKELADRRMKAAIVKSEIEVLVKEMQEMDRERQRFYIQLIVGGFVFAAMTIWGFLKWRKIQLLADERFEIELADLKKKH